MQQITHITATAVKPAIVKSIAVKLITVKPVAILSILLVLFIAACGTPHEFEGTLLEEARPVFDAVGSDHFGEPFRLSEHQGKFVLVNFGYTSCPDICPLTLHEMAGFYTELAEQDADLANQVEVLFVTVDPKRDVPDRLQQYVGAFHDDFWGLHIEDEETLEITKKSFAVFAQIAEGSDPESDNYFVDHTGGIFVLNPEGKWTLFFPHDVTADAILADMTELLGG